MPISPISLYKLYTYTQYILIHAITLYGKLAYTWVYANTGYTPIRRGCVYAYKLILFHDV